MDGYRSQLCTGVRKTQMCGEGKCGMSYVWGSTLIIGADKYVGS
jgi:hypothetical protein